MRKWTLANGMHYLLDAMRVLYYNDGTHIWSYRDGQWYTVSRAWCQARVYAEDRV